jgi:hypothetical protein
MFGVIKSPDNLGHIMHLQIRQVFCLCVYSYVRTLNQARKLENLKTEMQKNEVSVKCGGKDKVK